MQAAVFTGANRPLELETLEVDEPRAGEVRVRMLASGICHSDLHVVEGEWPEDPPIVLGHEGFGEVEAVGDAVAGVAAGDRVVLSWYAPCGDVRPLSRGPAVDLPALELGRPPDERRHGAAAPLRRRGGALLPRCGLVRRAGRGVRRGGGAGAARAAGRGGCADRLRCHHRRWRGGQHRSGRARVVGGRDRLRRRRAVGGARPRAGGRRPDRRRRPARREAGHGARPGRDPRRPRRRGRRRGGCGDHPRRPGPRVRGDRARPHHRVGPLDHAQGRAR